MRAINQVVDVIKITLTLAFDHKIVKYCVGYWFNVKPNEKVSIALMAFT